jgi:hypothetical protein
LKDIKNSLIIVGHVAGAAHITAVQDSIIVVASRQVRMHDCNNVDIYLHCSSRPIIEDCRNVRFAPIPACHVSSHRMIHDLYKAKMYIGYCFTGASPEPVGSG